MGSTRLYCKGRVLGHKRAKRNSRPNTSLLQIEGVNNKEDCPVLPRQGGSPPLLQSNLCSDDDWM
ncbi:hypothetical protein F5J12DRAFT_822969, partial [Pisolithus orientalis]|uniref:uncharacterized protein n=1 Tax=Pisolithus orientalis TaxID=936130 RepID=UPI0022240844